MIIVNYNSGLLLSELIESFKALNASLDEFEFVVVDNASRDDSLSKVRWGGLNKKLILNKQNYGFAKANNQGIALSRGAFIILLNPDTKFLNNIFIPMEEVMLRDKSIGICGPRLYYSDGTGQLSCFSFPSILRQVSVMIGLTDFLIRNQVLFKWMSCFKYFLPKSAKVFSTNFNDIKDRIEVPWISGACMMIKKEVIDKIGMLDENFFAYVEDEDFCLRARQAGYKIYYVSQAHLIHHLGWNRFSKKSKELVDIYFASLNYFYTKHFKGFKKIFFILLNKLDWALNKSNKGLVKS